MAIADLRQHPDIYAAIVARTGWPADPAQLDDHQLSDALIGLFRPELLRELPFE